MKYGTELTRNFATNKTKVTTIALVLVLTIAALITCLPTVNATDYPTFAFLAVAPNPVGVGQTVYVSFWLSQVPPTAMGPSGAYGDRWQGYKVTITKPDGTSQTLGPYTSDPVGAAWTSYTPDQTGTYYFQFSFPGQQIDGPDQYGNRIVGYWQPSTSQEVELTVQQDPIEAYPDYPLPDPNEYWERPIEAQNQNWYTYGGNWLMQSYNSTYGRILNGGFNPYTTAPNTAHIVWTKPLAFGGIVGGEYGTHAYYTGLSYEFKFTPPIIMNGILYYNTPDYPQYGWYAVDLRTGETLWWHNSTDKVMTRTYGTLASWPAYPQLTLGQLYDYESANQHGVIPYLWSVGSTYEMYDAFTGNWILSLANASGGTPVLSKPTATGKSGGDLLVYVLNGNKNWLACWNSSKAILAYPGLSYYPWLWRPPTGETLDWRAGIEWNVTTPEYKLPYPQYIERIADNVIIAATGSWVAPGDFQIEIGYSAKTGEQLWVQNRTTAPGATAWCMMGGMGDGVYCEFIKETMQWYGYSITTGEKLWGPTEPYTSAWGMFSAAYCSGVAYGKLYAAGYDGMLHCYDVHTGEHLWDYFAGTSGYETVYGVYPLGFHRALAIADGKIFVVTGEHSPSDPLWRGSRLHVVDANTGERVWSILGWLQNPAIADGYLVANNGYDNKLYCFGKGKTATTVTAPDVGVTLGSSVMIRGTVTDQSPGAAGTPAIADEYMSEWMEYLYMQKPMPAYVEGVEVKLEVLDPNGNFDEIGRVTSDASGMFKLLWEPPVEGEYTIIATFEGSDSYWSSYAETAIGVTEAPSPAQPIQPEEPTGAFALGATEVAIIAAVSVAVVIGIVAYWTLRKRK